MIKVSPGLARIIKSFGKSRTSLPSANGTKIVIRNPELLRIIRYFRKASNQVKSSPLSLRSADIAKLINEKEYLKGQYDQQKEQGKAFFDNLLAQHNNLNIQYGNLQNQVNQLGQRIQNIKNHVNDFRNNRNNFYRRSFNNSVNHDRAVELFDWIADA